ncbi:MAG: tetratricopeptide repeat protein, partial [Pirellulales bacterium]
MKLIISLATAGIALCGMFSLACGEELAKATGRAMELDSPLERLEPVEQQSEAARHRMRALALYSAGRMLERKGDFSAALGRYQRSVRYDGGRSETFARIVTLSRSLNRHEETARYAYLMARNSPVEPIYLLLASIYLKQTEQFDEALSLYERALRQPDAPQKTAAWVELHKTAGEFYLRQQRYPEAAAALAHVEQALNTPDDYQLNGDALKLVLGNEAALYRLFGEAYLLADQPVKAVAAFEQADQAAPGEGLLLYQLARVDRRIGEIGKAVAKIEKYMAGKYDSLGLAPYQFLEKTLAEANRSDELVPRLRAAFGRDAGNHRLAYFLGEKLRQQGQLQDARTILEQANAEEPTANAYLSLSQIYRAERDSPALLHLLADAAGRTGSLGMLEDELAAIAADDKLVASLLELANRRENKQKLSPKQAEPAAPAEEENPFQIVADAEQQDRRAFGVPLAAGLLAAESQKYDEAESFFTEAATAEPERREQVLLSWGLTLLIDGQHARAAEVFRKGTLAPTPPLARPTFYFYLSGSLAALESYDEALDAVQQAMQLRGKSPEYLGRIGWVLYRGGKLPESAAAYRELIEEYQDEFYAGEVRQAVRDARLTLASVYMRQNESAAAIEMLEQVLDEFPDHVGAKNDLGYIWADNHMNLEMALTLIQDAVTADPDNAAYQDSLGWALHRLGRHAEALPPLQKAAAGDEPDGVILDHLGDVLIALDRPAEALDAWRRA